MPIEIRRQPLVIAIDGPAGAGKSTVAQQLARALDLPYVDTGATYRAAALKVLKSAIAPTDDDRVARLIATADLEGVAGAGSFRVLLDGRDVTGEIRSPEVTEVASLISRIPGVRHAMIALQRTFARGKGVVMEGRDIGTVVFPDAAFKIFLNASPIERARRRMADEQTKSLKLPLAAVAREIEQRDQRDSQRKISPLIPAPDACRIDSTGTSAGEVVRKILRLLEERNLISEPLSRGK